LAWLSAATRLPMSATMHDLGESGLSPGALGSEIERARRVGVRRVLAGIELVEIADLCTLDERQIAGDLSAFRAAGADGLVLSWDLWHIPQERLNLVATAWGVT
jgi:hypothetical protein